MCSRVNGGFMKEVIERKSKVLKQKMTSLLLKKYVLQCIKKCKLNVEDLFFGKMELQDVLIALFKEETVSLNDLEYLNIPSSMIDYVSARKWFTDKEIHNIANMHDDELKALAIIGRIYGERNDRSGNPQTRHLISVSNAMKTKEGKVVGLLHDVVEDGYLTLMSLLCLFRIHSREVQAIDILTRDKELYPKYNDYIEKRILFSRSLIVLEAKDADMKNNQSYERVKDLPTEEQRHKALTKYKTYIPLVEARILELKLERKRSV